MKILITGVTGYIGSRLAQRLCFENQVYALVRQPLTRAYLNKTLLNNITLLYFDGRGQSVLDAVKDSEPDIVYHLASHYTGAHDFDSISKMTQANLFLGTALLEAMSVKNRRKLVYMGSLMQFFNGVNYKPQNLYAATKQAFSDIVEYYTDSGQIDAAEVILSESYGPYDKRPKVLNLIKNAITENNSLSLTSGRQIYDLLYIDDIIDGLVAAASALENPKSPHQYFQLKSENPLTLIETVNLLTKINGLEFKADWGGRAEPTRQNYNPSNVYPPPPNWRQKISLEDGLRLYWRENKY